MARTASWTRGEEVDAGDGEVAAGVLGLLLQVEDVAVVVDDGDAEGGGVGDAGEQDLRVAAVLAELVDDVGDPVQDEVVAEVHDEVVVAEEGPGDEDGVGEPGGVRSAGCR